MHKLSIIKPANSFQINKLVYPNSNKNLNRLPNMVKFLKIFQDNKQVGDSGSRKIKKKKKKGSSRPTAIKSIYFFRNKKLIKLIKKN